jgi:hypothetical protein
VRSCPAMIWASAITCARPSTAARIDSPSTGQLPKPGPGSRLSSSGGEPVDAGGREQMNVLGPRLGHKGRCPLRRGLGH